MTRPGTLGALALSSLLALTACAATPASGPSASPPSTVTGPVLPSLNLQPSGKTVAEVLAALPQKLGGRPRADNGTNPRQTTVAAKPATVHAYVYKGREADDYVAVTLAATEEAAVLFPVGVARLRDPQAVAGAMCGVGSVDGRQMNVCYALLNDGVLTVAEPAGKMASLGAFTDRLAHASP
nr:hypothetical protein [Propionibacterium sp.]